LLTVNNNLMEYRDALNTILMHGIGRNDVPTSEALYEHGFIGCLRPWTGLRDENFKELLTAIISLRHSLAGRDAWPIELVAGIMGITRMAHCWAIDDAGMLRRNRLISDDDIAKLRHWVQRIESVAEQLLMGNDPLELYPDLLHVVQ
jgi:hypothetical protein